MRNNAEFVKDITEKIEENIDDMDKSIDLYCDGVKYYTDVINDSIMPLNSFVTPLAIAGLINLVDIMKNTFPVEYEVATDIQKAFKQSCSVITMKVPASMVDKENAPQSGNSSEGK